MFAGARLSRRERKVLRNRAVGEEAGKSNFKREFLFLNSNTPKWNSNYGRIISLEKVN